ncbi:hypothetical protein ACIRTB_21330 [Streptomyces sp. NPDC101158]|uniref:hypothetical protein n=1 Tax=Streptomyces sp. NPDC101158 TaxID=3366117 RepID=UPI003801D76A
MARESIAAEVGAGIDGQGRFRPVAAWAWMFRNFDTTLPDVTGAAWQTDTAGRSGEPERRAAEAEGYTRYLTYGPW